MKLSIDDIFAMLSCSNDWEIQKKGIEEACKIKHLSIFMRPIENKATWENCARVLVKKSDDELRCYVYELFEWLQDMNWPGAYLIYDRLKRMSKKHLDVAYWYSLERSLLLGDVAWEQVLRDFSSREQ